jgi:hypothetical protein
MSFGLKELALRYSGALLPSIIADYLVYLALIPLLHHKFISFVIGRFVGFIIFYTLATRQTRPRRIMHFAAFFVLFLCNIFASWLATEVEVIPKNFLMYKVALDLLLFCFNFLFFRIVHLDSTNLARQPHK